MTARKLSVTIQRARKAKGWSQEELARKSGVSQPYLSQLEAGTYKNPGVEKLKKLAKALGVKVGRLLE